jgi:molybdate transport system substrate-binding protein
LRSSPIALLCAALFAIAATLPRPASADEVVVFAAASLKTALDEIADKWQRESGNVVMISYAGSGLLAKQIIAGAPADIFVSAAENWMDEVDKARLIVDGRRKDLVGNTLVLIAHREESETVSIEPGYDLPALLGDRKLAMALVDAVPAGQYGKAALTALGIWDRVAPSVAQADNARAALALVSTGEAPYGIVYATDAAADDRVAVVGRFPAESHPPIAYPAALLTGSKDAADQAFYDALFGETARRAFARQGFKLLN